MSAGRLGSLLIRLGRALRNSWLIGGLTLLGFLGLEFGYRGIRAVRAHLAGPDPVVDSAQHPYAALPWWSELQHDLRLRRNRFDPYRSHWSLPQASRYVHIDSLGRRVTPQPPIPGRHRLLFLLGGSTAWGYSARDSATIGAGLAAELRKRGIADVEVVNLAQAAFNSTQEATTLLVELAQGRVPALVVLLDGYNDIATTGKYGEPGHTYGDEGIQQQLDRGRRSFGQELLGLGEYSAIVRRLQRLGGLLPQPTRARPATAICGAVAAYYRRLAAAEQALGRESGFPVIHFLQPHHAVSGKPMTRWEARLPIAPLARPCMASLDSAMSDLRGSRFFSLVQLFDQDTATVFLDADAHLTEAGNARVAERIAAAVAPLLARRASEPQSRRAPAMP